MTTTTANSIFVRPWAREASGEGALKDVLKRVNFERGHFRDITEASLQEEIANEGALESSESEEDDSEEEISAADQQKAKYKATTREELYKAKYEMLSSVRAAEQEILMSLDFVSLLLSKDMPKSAQTTISPFLKQNVPMGTLGTDIWQRMPIDTAKETQEKLLAINVRMDGLQKSADDLLAAAARLEKNVRTETHYWDQILSVSTSGWSVCKIPGQQHRLGVRFGFRESAPQYARQGIAALNPSEDGTIVLERSIGSQPRCLKAILRRGGDIVGTSRVHDTAGTYETTLEARLRYARDSLYDEELFHEVTNESRILTSLGVHLRDSTIQIIPDSQLSGGLHISLELTSPGDHNDLTSGVLEEDTLAQAVVLAARLLLHQGHQERLKQRSKVPEPLSGKSKEDRPVLPILRPIISFFKHIAALAHVNEYVEKLQQTLNAASIQNECTRANFSIPKASDVSSSESLTKFLIQPLRSEAEVYIHRDDLILPVTFGIETTLEKSFGSVFTLQVPSRDQPYRLEVIEDVIMAADLKVASVLAQAILPKLGEEWECNEQEALLSVDCGAQTLSRVMRITLESEKLVLRLQSPQKEASWGVDSSRYEKGFWDTLVDFRAPHEDGQRT